MTATSSTEEPPISTTSTSHQKSSTITDIEYTITDSAYLLIILHAAKYFTSITGLLIGTYESPNKVKITQTLPLAHSDISQYTTPLIETALLLSDEHTKLTKSKIVGIYYANGNPTDVTIPHPPTRIADKIRETFPLAVILHIDPDRLQPSIRRNAHCARVRVKVKSSVGSWVKAMLPSGDRVLKVDDDALKLGHQLLMKPGSKERVDVGGVHVEDVVDFEDHCLDPRYDWLNEQLVNRLDSLLLSSSPSSTPPS